MEEDKSETCKGDGSCLMIKNMKCNFDCNGSKCNHKEDIIDNDTFCLVCSIKKWNNDKLKRKFKKDDYSNIEIKESPIKKQKYEESKNNIIDINNDTPTFHSSCLSSTISDEDDEDEDDKEKLSPSQKEGLKYALERKNLFITGSAGCGKSFLIEKLKKVFWDNNLKLKVTALTGSAAHNIKGVTFHHFMGWKLADEPVEEIIKNIKKNRTKVQELKQTDVLIIDEVSMLKPELLIKFEAIISHLREGIKGSQGKPFGGLQLILVGDLYQLPFIIDDKNKKKNGLPNKLEETMMNKMKQKKKGEIVDQSIILSFNPEKDTHIFNTQTWKNGKFKIINLNTNFRQNKDDLFITLLNNLRIGKLTDNDKKALKERVNAYNKLNKGEIDNMTILYSRRDKVFNRNKEQLAKVKGKKRIYKGAIIDRTIRNGAFDDKSKTNLFKQTPIEDQLELKIGAHVLLCSNLEVGSGLYNGTPGKVIAFSEYRKNDIKYMTLESSSSSSSSSKTLSTILNHLIYNKDGDGDSDSDDEGGGGEDTSYFYNDDISEEEEKDYSNLDSYRIPIVEFSNGLIRAIDPYKWEVMDGKHVLGAYCNLPLILRYAITVHKAQGLTLEKAIVSMDAFTFGQCYTSFSRVREIEDLYITNYNESSIYTDRKVHEFYKSNNLI